MPSIVPDLQEVTTTKDNLSELARDLTVYLPDMNVSCVTFSSSSFFLEKSLLLPLFPQSCFEEEVFLILSNVHFQFSALDLTRFHFSCTLFCKLLLLYLPHSVSFSTLTSPHGLQMSSLSPIKMKQLQFSHPFHDHPVYGSFFPSIPSLTSLSYTSLVSYCIDENSVILVFC